MAILLIVFTALLSLHTPAGSATTTDTISPGQQLGSDDKLVSKNGRYALGFFETGSESYSQNTTTRSSWYLGIWFNTVPKLTPAWVANRDSPVIRDATTSLTLHLTLTLSHDGNLVILHESSNSSSMVWSTQANITSNDTIAVLSDSGNLILQESSNSSAILWQSFDYPTDTFFPGAKLGLDKVTGLNRRLVSWKNSISPATGMFCEELDPSGANQLVQVFLAPLNSPVTYWSTGVWNGQYFPSVPEMSSHYLFNFIFVNNDQEQYYTYTVKDEAMIVHRFMETSGQTNTYIWSESSLDWVLMYAQPTAQCDVYATCGPFTICNDNELPYCSCIRGFTVRSPEDWELDDRSGGCLRDTPLDCISHRSTVSTDKFYSMPCVRLPQSANSMINAANAGECAQVCLSDCTCTAYFFGSDGCFVWHNELLNIQQQQCSAATGTDGETLYLRLAAKELQVKKANRKGMVIGVAIGASFIALGLLAVLILVLIVSRNKTKVSGAELNSIQDCNGITAFRYIDLQRATKSFSEKLGGGSFGSVFKGFLSDSTTIAVKRLDHACQGEKQFRAEVSSVGIIRHINLVKLIGFCCEGGRRLLVYEHMPNRSLDLHLFQSNNTISWNTRYQIALGVARGLAYLHESCHDCIIHCDIKPENILLDSSFVPKIADFGLAKFLGRDFSRVLTTFRGTVGYLAPEWISGIAVTPKVDVYSYGMVLWEIISGRRNSYSSCSCGGNHDIYFPVHAAHKLLEGDVSSLVDDMLQGDADLNKVEIACKVACWCIQDDELDRPTMGEVIQILEGIVEKRMPPMPRMLRAMAGNLHLTCSESFS